MVLFDRIVFDPVKTCVRPIVVVVRSTNSVGRMSDPGRRSLCPHCHLLPPPATHLPQGVVLPTCYTSTPGIGRSPALHLTAPHLLSFLIGFLLTLYNAHAYIPLHHLLFVCFGSGSRHSASSIPYYGIGLLARLSSSLLLLPWTYVSIPRALHCLQRLNFEGFGVVREERWKGMCLFCPFVSGLVPLGFTTS
ncbi:hypothetical protein FA13DRAFT_191455 [Coprinellus micaceus]|uniref:Uncharacterized protein n=1 Tax=Coprinellus micaceus TaxID=71717 RepID=A0A4Y7TGP1_COPMI|nr:hypothetical protein FA13DRAFT_191455 [Coprinellus micaceus]